MNWNMIDNQQTNHNEITLQIYYANGRPLSNLAVVPFFSKSEHSRDQPPFTYIFLQIPVQALLTSNLALIVKVYNVRKSF